MRPDPPAPPARRSRKEGWSHAARLADTSATGNTRTQLGIAQFVAVVDHGYAYARSLEFYRDWEILQWLRLAGDAAFLSAGLVLLWDLVQKLLAGRIVRASGDVAPRQQ